jgi:hypothetical protein
MCGMLSSTSPRKPRKGERSRGLSSQSHRLTYPKHIVRRLTAPYQADLTYRECNRLPGRLKRPLERKHLALSTNLPHTEMRCEAMAMAPHCPSKPAL